MSLFELFDNIKYDNIVEFRRIINENPNLINKYLYGVTPLLFSIESDRNNIAIDLCLNDQTDFELKDNVEKSCLEKAIEHKMYTVVEIICKKLKFNKEYFLENKETLLTNSLKMNDQNVSIALIKGGFELNVPNKFNEYPIQLAIKFNKIKVVKAMLEQRIVFLGSLETGYNALLDACERDLTDIAVLIIDNGICDINAADKEQHWTSLMHAITNNNETIIKHLLEKHCDFNTTDVEGNTPLHLAVLNENEYSIKMLLKHCPSLTIKNKENMTAKELAKKIDESISVLIG